MNKTLIACTIAAFSMSAPALAAPSGTSSSSTNASSATQASNPHYSGYYYIVGTQVKRMNQDPSASYSRLTEAAQQLRDAIQQIAQHPAGEDRNAAIRTAHRALFDTQQAMIDLPPELRRSSSDGAMSKKDYDRSLEKLKQAAQTLRESAQAMAQQPAGEGRNQAVDQVNEAILELNQAMVQLPWEPDWMRNEGRSASDQSDQGRIQGRTAGNAMAAFDRIDANSDGMLSRDEFRKHMTQQSEQPSAAQGRQAASGKDRKGWFNRGQALSQPNDPHTVPSHDGASSPSSSEGRDRSTQGSASGQERRDTQGQEAASAYQAAR